jgi:hypothetical protein
MLHIEHHRQTVRLDQRVSCVFKVREERQRLVEVVSNAGRRFHALSG